MLSREEANRIADSLIAEERAKAPGKPARTRRSGLRRELLLTLTASAGATVAVMNALPEGGYLLAMACGVTAGMVADRLFRRDTSADDTGGG